MRRRRPLGSRVRGWLRTLLAFLFSNVGVVVLVVGYTVAGAFMFQAIEGASEMERVNLMERERDSTAQYLWQNVTLRLNPLNETALKHSISAELQAYQRKVVAAARRGWDGRGSRQWSFSSAFLYSLTVITTIGYGHLSPRTSWGKVTTILYALLGMPLFLLYLSNVGELLARWFKCLYALVCLCRGCPGFTRRRVVRIRTQLEVSEPESIEGPVILQYSDSDVTPARYPDPRLNPYRYHPDYRIRDPRIEYSRYKDFRDQERGPERLQERFHEERFQRRFEGSEMRNARRQFQRRPDYSRSYPYWVPTPRFPEYGHQVYQGYQDTRRSEESSEFSYVTFDAQTITVPLSVCIFILVGYIIFGSMLFGMWEQWDQLDGAYFCFISLSSIGFGDFVPGERVYTPRIETSFIACSLYLMLGMALVAMCFNLMQEQVMHYAAGVKRAIKRICRCKR